MDVYLKLLYEIPAAVALGPLLVNVLPFSVDKKFNPIVMFLTALLAIFFPLNVDLALAMCIPIGHAYRLMGIRLQGHEPVRIPVARAREFLASRLRRPETGPEEVLTREYPDPEGDIVPGIPSYVPAL